MYRTAKIVRFRDCVQVTWKKVTEKFKYSYNCGVKCVQIILTCFWNEKNQLRHAEKNNKHQLFPSNWCRRKTKFRWIEKKFGMKLERNSRPSLTKPRLWKDLTKRGFVGSAISPSKSKARMTQHIFSNNGPDVVALQLDHHLIKLTPAARVIWLSIALFLRNCERALSFGMINLSLQVIIESSITPGQQKKCWTAGYPFGQNRLNTAAQRRLEVRVVHNVIKHFCQNFYSRKFWQKIRRL